MSNKLKVIIIEDELLARTSLERLCSKTELFESVEVFENAENASNYIIDHEVDLIFLDIQLPGISGIEFLENLPVLPQIVFTTAHEDYAFQAYEYDVTDYLKKPVSLDRFERALEKIKLVRKRAQKMSELSQSSEIYIKEDKKLIRIPFEKILYFENAGDYISIVTTSEKYLIYGTIKAVSSRLRHPRMIKIHRSFIINLDYVNDIEDGSLTIGKKVIPISRAHRSNLLSTINVL